MKLPTNEYDDDTSERDVLMAVFEQMRGIRTALWALVVLMAVLIVVLWAGLD